MRAEDCHFNPSKKPEPNPNSIIGDLSILSRPPPSPPPPLMSNVGYPVSVPTKISQTIIQCSKEKCPYKTIIEELKSRIEALEKEKEHDNKKPFRSNSDPIN